MQELSLYTALLAELSDQELVSLVGLELHRRKCCGAILGVQLEGNHVYFVGVYPEPWEKLHEMSLTDQLKHLAAFTSTLGGEQKRYEVTGEIGDGA